MINYFKRLIPDLSKKELPLIELLRKGVTFKWNRKRENAFREIKNVFLNNLRIYHPNYNLPFILRTNASIHSCSGVLLQTVKEEEHPIYFLSRLTKKHEKNYSVSELELASIIFCLNKLRFYLLWNYFTVETDHSALTSILNNTFANSRIYRWFLLLQEYNFKIKYIQGKPI